MSDISDLELLKLAAKAVGFHWSGLVDDMIAQPNPQHVGGLVIVNERGGHSCWNPLRDDGDALRLVVKLNLTWMPISKTVVSCEATDMLANEPAINIEHSYTDLYAATRLCIVKSAADIGRSMHGSLI